MVGKKIRRWGSMVRPTGVEFEDEEQEKEKRKRVKKEMEGRSYEMLLVKCGSSTNIQVLGRGLNVIKTVTVKYEELRGHFPDGFYREGIGYVIDVDLGDIQLMAEIFDDTLSVLCEVVDQEEARLELLGILKREGVRENDCYDRG